MDKIPNIRHLRVFREVAELHSVSAAAEREFLSQPAVTQAIGKLEADFGVSLLDRRSDGLFTTEIGELFLRRVGPALEHLRVGAREATRQSLGKGGRGFPNFDRLVTAAQLRALVAVVDAASFSMAARSVGISQPSIHRATRNLERLSGLRLFEATHEGISPTPAAQVLAQHVKLALSEIRQKATRRVQIRVVDGPYNELLRGLRYGDLDCIIGALRTPQPADDIVQEPLFNAPLVIVAGRHHPLAKQRNVSLGETLSYPWVAPPRTTPAGMYLFNTLAVQDLEESPVRVVSSSLVLIRGLLQAGNYLTIITPQQVRHEFAEGILVPIDIDLAEATRPIGLTYRRDWRPTRTQTLFMDELRSASRIAAASMLPDDGSYSKNQ